MTPDQPTEDKPGMSIMLPLWLQAWITPCPWAAWRMGYLREVVNIRRCWHWWHTAWEPHFRQTQDTIRQAIARCPQRRVAVLLGSGWLHDVPLSDLATSFEEVRLVDVIHPLPVRWRLRAYPNVRLIHHDITTTTDRVYRHADDTEPLPISDPKLYLEDSRVDLVASVNILSQLPYLHVEHLLGRRRPREAVFSYARQVIRAHLDYLTRMPGVKTIIADVDSTRYDTQGQRRERTGTLYGEPFPWAGNTWRWTLVPRQGRPPFHSFVRTVQAVVWDTVPPLKSVP